MKNIINMLKRGDELMPLTMIDEGIPYTIQRIGGKEEIRRFLENLGFVPGAVVPQCGVRPRIQSALPVAVVWK